MTAPFHPTRPLPGAAAPRPAQFPPGPAATGDIDDMRAMLHETLTENATLVVANAAHRRTLGWLLGHPDALVVAATHEALRRYGADRPEPVAHDPDPVQIRTRSVTWPLPFRRAGA
jgi:hypothetical protein